MYHINMLYIAANKLLDHYKEIILEQENRFIQKICPWEEISFKRSISYNLNMMIFEPPVIFEFTEIKRRA